MEAVARDFRNFSPDEPDSTDTGGSIEEEVGKFSLTSDSIGDGEEIDTDFIYSQHHPFGLNKQPHLKLSGLKKDKSTCGVVVIHDSVDADDWCHGVLIFGTDTEIAEDSTRKEIKIARVLEGINDLNRGERGDLHHTEQEVDPDGIGYIGPYPGYDQTKSQEEQPVHEYNFDAYEVDMTVKELLFAVAKVTRQKLGEVLEGSAEDFSLIKLKKMAVLTMQNVLEAISGHVLNKSGFTGTYKNPGWHGKKWVGPTK